VQPGGTGVILAGTGDPNDELDSYYGAGILRSADGGNSWTLIQTTVDSEQYLGGQDFSFVGEGFSGFAWSTLDAQRVVAAVSQAWEGVLVNADRSTQSYEGLYYSKDGGVSWHLATITDGSVASTVMRSPSVCTGSSPFFSAMCSGTASSASASLGVLPMSAYSSP